MRQPATRNFSTASQFYGTEVRLPQGTDKKSIPYDRVINFPPGSGMQELTDIVAKLGKDFKRFNQCITLAGAEAFAARQGPNWSAFEADVTGPHGEKDGINEVFVADSSGNIKVVNGVGLQKSDYPMKQAYYTTFPTREDRRENPYTDFKQRTRDIGERDAETMKWAYANDINEIGGEYANFRPAITAREVFKQLIFKPVYDGVKQDYMSDGLTGMNLAQVFNIGLSTTYHEYVIKEAAALKQLTEQQLKDPRQLKKVKADQPLQMNVVNSILDQSVDDVMAGIAEILGGIAVAKLEEQAAATAQPVEAPPPSPQRNFIMSSPGRRTFTPKNAYQSPTKK